MTRETATSRRRSWTYRAWAVLIAVAVGVGPGVAPAPAQDDEGFQTTAGKKKHRKRQNRPIELGTSGSNANDFGFNSCCVGTLGALIDKFGVQYVLSNNHVIGRTNQGKAGEAILQPGLVDQSCPAQNEELDTVARLTARKKVKFGLEKQNKVDLAIAEVVPGAVKSSGKILKIGVPGSEPAEAFIGMEVQKAGRTTGLTRGVVTAVNATVFVPEYPLECGSSESRPARFVNQIFITGADGRRFLDSGDSGSMVYEDRETCPAPVGLLFAGSGPVGAAAPADVVLKMAKKLKPKGDASFVGCQAAAFETASRPTPILRPDRVRQATGRMRQWEDDLLLTEGVQAVGIGMTLSGPVDSAIHVYSTRSPEEMRGLLPERIGDFRVEVIETDEFVAYCGPPPTD